MENNENLINKELQKKMLEICEKKIKEKDENVGISFYAFFSNKNNDPDILMNVAYWWIKIHKLDHFEKAIKIKNMIIELMKK